MFTSISKQPIDLGGISVQIKATCEIWGTESNFKYPPQEGHEKPRKVNVSHRDHSLHSAAHTFVIYHAHIMRMQEHARNLHLTSDPFETLTKTASVSQVCGSWNTLTNARWMQCILIIPNCPLCHSIMKKKLNRNQMGLWHKAVGAVSFWMGDGVQPFSAGGETEGVRRRLQPPDPALLLGLKSGTEDPFPTGSHNQQHLRSVLCNPS